MKTLESHFTTTGVVMNANWDKTLLIFHKKLQKWLPAGGHVDAGELPHDAVVREVFEETGVKATLLDACPDLALNRVTEIQIPTPICVLHELIPARKDKPEHMHYDFIYLLVAENEDLNPQFEEVCQAGWFDINEIEPLDSTDGTRKLCQRLFSGVKLNNVF